MLLSLVLSSFLLPAAAQTVSLAALASVAPVQLSHIALQSNDTAVQVSFTCGYLKFASPERFLCAYLLVLGCLQRKDTRIALCVIRKEKCVSFETARTIELTDQSDVISVRL